jgi:hypothetical protein
LYHIKEALYPSTSSSLMSRWSNEIQQQHNLRIAIAGKTQQTLQKARESSTSILLIKEPIPKSSFLANLAILMQICRAVQYF